MSHLPPSQGQHTLMHQSDGTADKRAPAGPEERDTPPKRPRTDTAASAASLGQPPLLSGPAPALAPPHLAPFPASAPQLPAGNPLQTMSAAPPKDKPPPPAGAPPPQQQQQQAGGSWVWRADIPNPNGSYGNWSWVQAGGPQAYPQQPQYGAAAAAFGGWGGPQGMQSMQSMPGMAGMAGMGAMQAYPYQQQQAAMMMGQYGQAMAAGQYGQYGASAMQYGQPPYMQAQPQAQHSFMQQQQQQQYQRPVGSPAVPHRVGGFSRGPTGPRDPAVAAAIAINKRITAAQRAEEIFAIIENESGAFDIVCLATCFHKLANMKGAPNLHATIVNAPEFYRLKQICLQRRSEFSARNVSNSIWSLAKMNHNPGEEFLQAMADEMVKPEKMKDAVAQNVANALWSFATLGHHPGEEVLTKLAGAVKSLVPQFTSQNISNAIIAFAKLEFRPEDDVLVALAADAVSKIHTFTPQALSNCMWGLSKLEIRADDLMTAIGAAASAQLFDFNAQNLANLLWAYANLEIDPGDELLRQYVQAAGARLPEFASQNTSNFLWALAKLGKPEAEFFAAAAAHAARTMHTFTPQALANLIWSFATLAIDPGMVLVQQLVGMMKQSLTEYTPQNLSNTAWAVATLRDASPSTYAAHANVMSTICGEVMRRLNNPDVADSFSRQHLSNLAWALASLEFNPGRQLLGMVAGALATRAEDCLPQEVGNSIWAFGRIGFYHAGLMASMAEACTTHIEDFSQQNLSNIAWGCARLGHFDEDLLTALANRALTMVEELSVQHITNMTWAYAVLHFQPPGMVEAFVAECKRRMGEGEAFGFQGTANLMWSLAVMNAADLEIWNLCIGQIHMLVGYSYKDLPPESLSQIFQAHMVLGALQPGTAWVMPPELAAVSRAQWVAQTRDITVSEFHSEVSRTLSALGIDHAVEHLTDDQLFSMDIALESEKIAIEVDGPQHFTINTKRPLGDMYVRRVLLEARGWRVVSVPFYLWADSDSMDTRKGLLSRLLAQTRTTGASVHPTLMAPIPTADVPPAAALAPPTAPQVEVEAPAAADMELGTHDDEPLSPAPAAAAAASAGKVPLAEPPAGPEALLSPLAAGERPLHPRLAEPPAGHNAVPSPATELAAKPPNPAASAAAPAPVLAAPPAGPGPETGSAPLQLSPQMPPLRSPPNGSVPPMDLAPAGPNAPLSDLEAAKAAAMRLADHMSGGNGSG